MSVASAAAAARGILPHTPAARRGRHLFAEVVSRAGCTRNVRTKADKAGSRRRSRQVRQPASAAFSRRFDPYNPKSAFEVFLENLRPGEHEPTASALRRGAVPALIPVRLSARPPPRPRDLSNHNRAKLLLVRELGRSVPELVYYEDTEKYVFYDAHPDARHRLLVLPRRAFCFPDVLNVPSLPVMTPALERIGDASDRLQKRPRLRDASVGYHCLIGGEYPSSRKVVRVHVMAPPTNAAPPAKPSAATMSAARAAAQRRGVEELEVISRPPRSLRVDDIIDWLVRHKRLSIDALRALHNYLKNAGEFYRFGSRFELLPPYEPVPSPSPSTRSAKQKSDI